MSNKSGMFIRNLIFKEVETKKCERFFFTSYILQLILCNDKKQACIFSFQHFHMNGEKKILFTSSSCMLGMYVCLPRYRQTRYGRNPAVWMKGPPKVKRISRTKKNPNGIIMHSTRPFTTSLYLSQHDQTCGAECSRTNWIQYLNYPPNL